MKLYILDFCKNCQLLLPGGVSQCPNCNSAVQERSERLQGTFPEEDGRAMLKGYGYEVPD